MKSVLAGILAAALIALGAWMTLDKHIRPSADQRFTTEGGRL